MTGPRPDAYRFILVGALGLLVMPVAGCGGDDGGAQRTMTVVGTEMAFEAPDRVVEGDYAVTFRNEGAVHHELAFMNSQGEFVGRRSIGPGQSTTMDVELEPGTWELGCYEPGHYDAGMHRPLIVEPE